MLLPNRHAMGVRAPPPLELFPDLIVSQDPILSIVKRTKEWSHYGHFDLDSLCKEATDFIVSNSDGQHGPITTALSKFLTLASKDELTILNNPATTSCWLTVRMTQADDEFVVPRWHQDGRMYECSCVDKKPHSKYAITLLGPSTRVLGLDGAKKLLQRGNAPDSLENRRILAAALGDCGEVEVLRGQVIRFSWGEGNSPVHSEPDSSFSDRVFVSVMFGSEEEMRNMCDWRGTEFVVRNISMVGIRDKEE